MEKILKNSLKIGLLLELVVIIVAFFTSSDLTTFFQTAARLSGRVSLLLFALVVYYFSLHWEILENEVKNEKYRLSRDFAIIHLIHWCFLAVAVSRSNFELKLERIIAGFIAYCCIVAFPYLLKNNKLDKNQYFKFQNFYIFYTWFIILMTYISRVKAPQDFSGSAIGYQLHLLAAIAILLVHFVLRKKSKLI